MCTGMTNGYDLRIEWYNKYGQVIQNSRNFAVVTEVVNTSPMTKSSRLNFIGLRPEMAGRYECRVMVNDQQDSISFDLNNIDAAPVNPGSQETKVCDIVEATCRNGECVSKSVLCNGVMDCSDGSDEQNCGGGNLHFLFLRVRKKGPKCLSPQSSFLNQLSTLLNSMFLLLFW